MSTFQKTIIENRGEIAISVMHAANKLDKQTASVYANKDKISLHLFKANEAYKLRMAWAYWPHI